MSEFFLPAVGIDLVCISAFAEQLGEPGTSFDKVFSAAELRRASTLPPPRRAEHLAGRWAAKEAFVKAWSQALYGLPPVADRDTFDFSQIAVQADAWGRVAYAVTPDIEALLCHSLKREAAPQCALSISHDNDYAVAVCHLI